MDTGENTKGCVYMYGYMCVCPGKAPGSEPTRGRKGQWWVISTRVSGVQGRVTRLSQMTDELLMNL